MVVEAEDEELEGGREAPVGRCRMKTRGIGRLKGMQVRLKDWNDAKEGERNQPGSIGRKLEASRLT